MRAVNLAPETPSCGGNPDRPFAIRKQIFAKFPPYQRKQNLAARAKKG